MRPYTEEALGSAMQEVCNGTLSLRAAAKRYSIPLTTLHDRKMGKIEMGAKWGKQPLLSRAKEAELLTYAMKRTDMGIGFTKQSFLRFAGQFARSEGVLFKDGIASEKWWRGLKARHPTFSLRAAESTSAGRHMAMTRIRISKYFAELKAALEENDLLNKASFIWNMDETGLSLATKPPKVLARKGTKTVHSKANNSRELITVVAGGNAEGKALPPHVIIPGKTKRALNSYDTINAPKGTNISVSDSGWTKTGIMALWFTETFLKNIGPERPQLLIMDGHESHHHVELIERAREEKIILVELPSKTSHYTQPFDRSVFKALKSSWGKQLHEFSAATGVTVGHGQFFRVLSKAWDAGITARNIAAGFVATGICPYNPGAIPDEAYAPSELYTAVPVTETADEPNIEPASSHSVACTNDTASKEFTVSVEICNADDSSQALDLPLTLNESGMIELLNTCGQNEQENQKPEIDSSALQIPKVTECSDSLALRVIESALTNDMKRCYENALSDDITLNDSMYSTWKMYRERLAPENEKKNSQSAFQSNAQSSYARILCKQKAQVGILRNIVRQCI